MADLTLQIMKPTRRRARRSALASGAPLNGPAPSPGFVTPWSGGALRWFERRGIEVSALFGWVGNGR